MRTQYPFCSLFLFTEGIQNKGSVRSEIQKIKVYCMQHQKLFVQFEKLPVLAMSFISNPKFSLMGVEKSAFSFLSQYLWGKKSQTADKSLWIGIPPVHTSFYIPLSIIHLKSLCDLESDLGLSSCWYLYNGFRPLHEKQMLWWFGG